LVTPEKKLDIDGKEVQMPRVIHHMTTLEDLEEQKAEIQKMIDAVKALMEK
jgi:hypothetical protein